MSHYSVIRMNLEVIDASSAQNSVYLQSCCLTACVLPVAVAMSRGGLTFLRFSLIAIGQ